MMSQFHSHLSLTCFSVNLLPLFSLKRCGASTPCQLHTGCYSDDRKERTGREIKTEERKRGEEVITGGGGQRGRAGCKQKELRLN